MLKGLKTVFTAAVTAAIVAMFSAAFMRMVGNPLLQLLPAGPSAAQFWRAAGAWALSTAGLFWVGLAVLFLLTWAAAPVASFFIDRWAIVACQWAVRICLLGAAVYRLGSLGRQSTPLFADPALWIAALGVAIAVLVCAFEDRIARFIGLGVYGY
jgi:hypothetical protein